MKLNKTLLAVVLVLSLPLAHVMSWAAQPISIGSKNFNESYLLSEIAAQLLESKGFAVERRFGLGGTLICYEALRNGEIDLYIEYTGTLSQAILNLTGNPGLDELNQRLQTTGLALLAPIGFNNTYAITVREEDAKRLGLESIGDLRQVPNLRMVFSHEFLERGDGWPGLSAAYGISADVGGIEHGLAYQAMAEKAIDVTDAYSTDGELVRYALKSLEDDLAYFPSYFAAPLVRQELPAEALDTLMLLSGSIDETKMQSLNAKVVFEGLSFAEVASGFLGELGVATTGSSSPLWNGLLKNTLRHLQLTGVALGLAILVGLSVGLLVYTRDWLSNALIYFCGLLQTIPSIALLALMIPLFGIGVLPAIVALFLYSLLPILRNAITALTNVDPTLVKVAQALGLTQAERLRYVLVPLSLPAIFAGIKTAAVISIGTATLAAFIGAGGLGEPIVVGLSLNDVDLILQGAIPAAVLAVLTELLFGGLERYLVQTTGRSKVKNLS
jgi:osmoprotectant transport system substrate-binding protein/osmoprotectant transport system permease protein